MSNKRGVGKTTIAVYLAYMLATKHGFKVGLLDIDIHGPNVPKMLSIENQSLYAEQGKILPLKINDNLYIISVGLLTEQNNAIIWRGPLKTKLIMQFVRDVKWPDLDFLIIDAPPGTGDEVITIMQLLKQENLNQKNQGDTNQDSRAIIVTMPSTLSAMDAVRAINMCKSLNIPVLGLIENFSNSVFSKASLQTTENIASQEQVKFLGKLSLSQEVAVSNEKGLPFVKEESIATREFSKIVETVLKALNMQN